MPRSNKKKKLTKFNKINSEKEEIKGEDNEIKGNKRPLIPINDNIPSIITPCIEGDLRGADPRMSLIAQRFKDFNNSTEFMGYKPFSYNMIHVAVAYHMYLKNSPSKDQPEVLE